ncbi:hypothetical protein TIFTF001_021828 [Ficus carica]|uniref:Uncharacterized protein n=1 Tax=Ficus carica TaxID=3494 RepID=A0AA88DDY8_FICCA|nr:hypothetical protein TIFTF001_021828 [Ficus carica]
MVSERFPISYHVSPRIYFKLLQEQQALINNLQANANRVEVPINPPAAQPVQNRGVQVATNHEPLYLQFKRMKPKEFNFLYIVVCSVNADEVFS